MLLVRHCTTAQLGHLTGGGKSFALHKNPYPSPGVALTGGGEGFALYKNPYPSPGVARP